MEGDGVESEGRRVAGFIAWWDDEGALEAGEKGESFRVVEGDVEAVAAGRDVIEGEAFGLGELQVGLVAGELEAAGRGGGGGLEVGAEEDLDVAAQAGGLELGGDAAAGG